MNENNREERSQSKNGNQIVYKHGHVNDFQPNYECNVQSPFEINFSIDLTTVILWILAVSTRAYRLGEPRAIVFDELHYGKYVGMYMKKMFFFDSNPPLGKQLIALMGYFYDFDGSFKFDKIGSVYDEKVPVAALRFIPSLFGSFLVPLAYKMCLQLELSWWCSLLAGFLVLVDNALLTQSRFILMECALLAFSVFGVYSFLNFRRYRRKPFCFAWWTWLLATSVSLTCSVCVKYCGIYTWMFCFLMCCRDFWKLLPDKNLSDKQLFFDAAGRLFTWSSATAAVYFGIFYVHLGILSKAGPHDNIMTTHFQASLEGGLKSIIQGQPLQIVHGSQITLRYSHGVPCWLHSHARVYPIRYGDNRGSSHQQQVTCYRFKDVNNWWIVKKPEINDLLAQEPLVPIRHGDVVQLVHGMTHRALNSHDVAAPMSPYNQEVSCYIDYNVSMPALNLWRVEIANRGQSNDSWRIVESKVRFVHVNTSQVLRLSGKQLPAWGFYQDEVVTDRGVDRSDVTWAVEEHRYTRGKEQNDREKELIFAPLIPLAPTDLGFWGKFLELQTKMLVVNQENVQHHLYSSSPWQWPCSDRGVAYWVSKDSNAQIHLIGNVPVWYAGSLCVFVYSGVLVFYVLRRRRKCYDVDESVWTKFAFNAELCLGLYVSNYLPYFLVDHTVFLHHYLPSLFFKLVLLACTVDHLNFLLRNHKKLTVAFRTLVILWIFSSTYVFLRLSVLSYGLKPLSYHEVKELEWKSSWNLIAHKK